MNFYHSSSFLSFSSFLLMTESRFWGLEQNTGNTLNSRVSKWALKFLAVKPATLRGIVGPLTRKRGRGLRGSLLKGGERKETLSRSLAGFKIHVDTLSRGRSLLPPQRKEGGGGERGRNYLLLALMSVAAVEIAFITRTSFTTGPRSSRCASSSRASSRLPRRVFRAIAVVNAVFKPRVVKFARRVYITPCAGAARWVVREKRRSSPPLSSSRAFKSLCPRDDAIFI